MANIMELLNIEKWLELNAKLQQKKNALRAALKEKGVLVKGKTNDFDHYKYFSEAQYKELFTELFSAHGLELKFDEVEYTSFEGTDKQPNGRLVRLVFTLFDTETGFYEETPISSEALDKGDKAGYKAYTGALKYYLANTFAVATGDDPETESPEGKTKGMVTRGNNPNASKQQQGTAPTPEQVAELQSIGVTLRDVAVYNKVTESNVTGEMVAAAIARKKKAQTESNFQRVKKYIENTNMTMDDVTRIAAELYGANKRINSLSTDEMSELMKEIDERISGGGDNE